MCFLLRDIKITMDLVFLNISTFDVIIGMDWLARHHAIVDCYLKKITFQSLDDSYMSFRWNQRLTLIPPIQDFDKKWLRKKWWIVLFFKYARRRQK